MLWGNKPGIGVGHNLRNKSCPGIAEEKRRALDKKEELEEEKRQKATPGVLNGVPFSTRVRDYGAGTTGTTMVAKYDDQTCICMWGETRITNFNELARKWYLNMDEFMNSIKDDPTSEGKTARRDYAGKSIKDSAGRDVPGELPFCVQFCSPAWLPGISLDKIQALRDYFCKMNWNEDEGNRCTCTPAPLHSGISSPHPSRPGSRLRVLQPYIQMRR